MSKVYRIWKKYAENLIIQTPVVMMKPAIPKTNKRKKEMVYVISSHDQQEEVKIL
jgi:hypothetical protein